MTAEHLTIEVFPGCFQLLIIARHDCDVVDLPGSQFPAFGQVLLDQGTHHLLRRLGARYVGEYEVAMCLLSVAYPTCGVVMCLKWIEKRKG